jgi:predicted HTH domain antitoxin
MPISFNIPPGVEQAIARSGRDPAAELKEAGLVELYRLGTISHGQLAEGLGISRAEVDAVLHRHGVTEDLPTEEEVGDQLSRLRKLVV